LPKLVKAYYLLAQDHTLRNDVKHYLNPIQIYGTPARNDWICKQE